MRQWVNMGEPASCGLVSRRPGGGCTEGSEEKGLALQRAGVGQNDGT